MTFFIISWVVLAFLVGLWGRSRMIQFLPALLYSLIFSPIVGMIIVSTYRKKRPEPEGIESLHFSGSAMVYYQRGEYDQAIKYYERSIKYQKTANAYFQLACLYSLIETPDKSIENLGEALNLGYENYEKIETHADLEFLRKEKAYEYLKKEKFAHLLEKKRPKNGRKPRKTTKKTLSKS